MKCPMCDQTIEQKPFVRCKAQDCGRERFHLGPCVKDPKPGVAYTDGLGAMGCGSWPRDENGEIVRSFDV